MSIFDAIKQVVHLHRRRGIKGVASPTCTSYFLAFNNRRHRYFYQRVMEGPLPTTWEHVHVRMFCSICQEICCCCSCSHYTMCQPNLSTCAHLSGFLRFLPDTWNPKLKQNNEH
ncbi:hypothetical protein AMTRI_Chr11g93160 [Amborella trichopoda]